MSLYQFPFPLVNTCESKFDFLMKSLPSTIRHTLNNLARFTWVRTFQHIIKLPRGALDKIIVAMHKFGHSVKHSTTSSLWRCMRKDNIKSWWMWKFAMPNSLLLFIDLLLSSTINNPPRHQKTTIFALYVSRKKLKLCILSSLWDETFSAGPILARLL